MNKTQEQIAGRLIELYHIIDFIDDGYHNEDINVLIKLTNELFEKLNPTNQEKFKEWLEKKIEERNRD